MRGHPEERSILEQLIARLAALDEEAGAVLEAVRYFDNLNEKYAGVEAFVRGAAILSGVPSGIYDPENRLRIFARPDGTAGTCDGEPDSTSATVPLFDEGNGVVWMECTAPSLSQSFVLDRLALNVRAVLERTRRRIVRDDGAALEVLFNATLPEATRLESAKRLGWNAESKVRALASNLSDNGTGFVSVEGVGALLVPASDIKAPERRQGFIGVGRGVPILEAHVSWAQAKTALRFTPRGHPVQGNSRVVWYSTLGSLVDLADLYSPSIPLPSDVVTLRNAIDQMPGLRETLAHVNAHPSLRAAAAHAHVHHSTLQSRVANAEKLLGWSITKPFGRVRLNVALIADLLCTY